MPWELDFKWFSYEEIMNMKEELRSYEWITAAINNYIDKKEYYQNYRTESTIIR